PEAELADERRGVGGQLVNGVAVIGDLAPTVTPEVEGDAAVAVLERVHLPVEHAPVHQHAVAEENRLPARVAAALLDCQSGAVDPDVREPWPGRVARELPAEDLADVALRQGVAEL